MGIRTKIAELVECLKRYRTLEGIEENNSIDPIPNPDHDTTIDIDIDDARDIESRVWFTN